MKYVIGVDIGLSGGISLINENNELIVCEPMPTITVLVNKKERKQYDIQNINKLIKGFISDYYVVKAGFERLRPIPHQSSQTGFSLGAGSMLFKTLFTVHGIPFMEMEPRSWQKKIFGDLGIQYNSKTTKDASIQAAKQLSPESCFLPTPRSRKDSDGLTDSFLIGIFINKD